VGQSSLADIRDVALLPAILLLGFAGIRFHDRSRGGFRAQKL
jgi:hypothetical protein